MANSDGARGRILVGEKTVGTPGTAERLVESADGARYYSVAIVAKSGNTGNVYLGGSDVDSDTHGGLAPGASVTFESRTGSLDLTEIYVDVDNGNEGVDLYALR